MQWAGGCIAIGRNCIARSGWIVLQHGGELYLRVLHCIAIEEAG